MRYKIDPTIVAPWQVEVLRHFAERWQHVLSCALLYSVQKSKRKFSQTVAIQRQATTAMRKFESETLTLEAVVDLLATWCGADSAGNKEETVVAWAKDPSTWGIVAAHEFAQALLIALASRPQLDLPLPN